MYLEIDQLRNATTKLLEASYRINFIPGPITRAELLVSLLKLAATNTIQIRRAIPTALSGVWKRSHAWFYRSPPPLTQAAPSPLHLSPPCLPPLPSHTSQPSPPNLDRHGLALPFPSFNPSTTYRTCLDIAAMRGHASPYTVHLHCPALHSTTLPNSRAARRIPSMYRTWAAIMPQ